MKFARHDFYFQARWLTCLLAFATFWRITVPISVPAATNSIVQYHSRTWQMDAGLPQDVVYSLAQTLDGYMWVGTQRGLARFDGVQFKVFDPQNTPALKQFAITALLGGSDGSLWIGTSGGLARWKKGVFVAFSLGDQQRGNNIKTIFEGKDGSMWIGTMDGLFHQEAGGWKHFSQQNGANDNVVRDICEVGDQLWIGNAAGVSILQNGKLTNRPGISDRMVRAILQDHNGALWFAMTSGLGCLKDGRFTIYTRRDGLADNIISELYEDKRGQLWVGTFGGLSRFVDGKFIIETDNQDGFYDQINTICEDQEGDIWLGTRDGLHELSPRQFTTYTRQDGLAHNNIMSVLEDQKGEMWIGTWGGGVAKLNDNGITTYNWANRQFTGLTSDLILGLFEDPDGSILIGTDYEGGTFRMKNGRCSRIFSQQQSMVDRVIRCIYRDREGNLWFGCGPGLILWNKHQKFLEQSAIRCMLEDRAGNFWVGTSDGLFCRKDGKFFNWSEREKLLDDVIVSLYEDGDGALWIGTGGSGLNCLRDGHLTAYTQKEGMFANDVLSVLEDDRGWLWMGTSRGIFRVSKKNLNDFDQKKTNTIVPVVYGRTDGLETVMCNGVAQPSAWKSHDGKLWFATAKGLAVTDPNLDLDFNSRPPTVFIEEIVADRQPHSLRNRTLAVGDPPTLRIPPGHGDLEIHYTALTFRSAEKVSFRYKLEGVDRDWVEVSRRVAYYNNLAPGNYKFHVTACNNDGIWNEADASIALVLAPHVWQTWWFIGSAALLAIALAGGIVRQMTRKNMRQKLRSLEKQHAIEEERIRIARDMHDEIGAKLTKISFMGAMAKRKLSLPDEAGGQIDKMSQTAREVIRALDEIVWAVNPANDTLEHLATYLCRNTTEFFEDSPVLCQFKIPDELPACRLGTDARHNILLASKEAMNNILKHADATSVLVEIFVETEKFRIAIVDNGCGIQSESGGNGHGTVCTARAVRVGSGLTNMRQRLAAIGGRCEVESRAGHGTRILFIVPLRENMET